MDRFDTNKNHCFTIIIVSLLLMVQEIKTRSTWKPPSDNNHQSLHSLLRRANLRHLHSRFHSHSSLSQSMDTGHEEINHHQLHHKHHLLKKRHDSSSVKFAPVTANDKNGIQKMEKLQKANFDVQVKKAENSSLCNYTVTPLKNRGDYLVPEDLVDITCNHRGSKCQASNTYCCIQTYTKIQVLLRTGGKKKIRINTGCICALQRLSGLEQDQGHPDINL